MPSAPKIVVPIDFSENSLRALAEAARWAHAARTPLHVLHVVDALVFEDLQAAAGETTALRQTLLASAEAQTEAAVKKLGIDNLTLKKHVSFGQPFVELERCVKDLGATLVIVGATGSGEAREELGSFASKCLRLKTTNVLVVKASHTKPFRTIVAGVDFSDASQSALLEAAQVAARDQAQLHIVHVFRPPWKVLHYRSPTPEAEPKFQEQFRLHLGGLMAQSVKQLKTQTKLPEVKTHLVEDMRPADGVLDCARTLRADLMVVGTHGKSFQLHLGLGSVAERIARACPCSVLTVMAPAA